MAEVRFFRQSGEGFISPCKWKAVVDGGEYGLGMTKRGAIKDLRETLRRHERYRREREGTLVPDEIREVDLG